ncbi:MAG: hypothetical protein M0Z49_14745 [Chloroflexi bacterium]|nr:hypothetical protein [Chloroflexota bacterium]
MTTFTESIVEEAALAVLGRLGWAVLHGPEIAVGTAAAERADPGFAGPRGRDGWHRCPTGAGARRTDSLVGS